jgi:hypothetical protein
MAADPTQALIEVAKILDPLSPEERRRVIKAFVGDEGSPASTAPAQTPEPSNADGSGHWANAQWMKKNGISADQLDHIFAFDKDKVRLNVDIPGSGMRPRAINVYLLVGLAAYLTSHDRFDDDVARGECERHSCYDKNNHGATLNKEMKSELMGSKSEGWKLTQPGINRATELVKEILGNTK